jgi:hypothetical protein
MPNKVLHLTLVYGLALFGLITNFHAAEKDSPPNPPDLTQGGKINSLLTWTLGSTGARGWVYQHNKSTKSARQIYVTEVDKGSPSDGVLEVGDVILGLDGEAFSSDPRKTLAEAITEAEKGENKGLLKFIRWRKGREENVDLKLKVMGSFSSTAPYDCEKSQRIVEASVKAILEDGVDFGVADPSGGGGTYALFNVLGLMATGREDVLPAINVKMRQIIDKPIDGYKWGHAWSLVTLAEYYLLTKDESVLPAIRKFATETANGQSKAGTWGHRFTNPDGSLRGYGTINQIGLAHTLGLVLAQKCGVTSPQVKRAGTKALNFFQFYTDRGSVPYGFMPPYLQESEANGMNSAAAVLFNITENQKEAKYFSKMGLGEYAGIETGHASNFFHLTWKSLAAPSVGPIAANTHHETFRWYYELLRDWRGKFRHHEAPNSVVPDKPIDATGARLLFYSLPLKKLYLTGKGGYVADPIDRKEAKEIVQTGSHKGRYQELSEETLLSRLGSWNAATRYRAAEELVKREGDWLKICLERLKKGSLYEKYGALSLIGRLKDTSVPALPLLIQGLGDSDLWIRVLSARALGAMGSSANPAIKPMLEAVQRDFPGDERKLFHSTLIDNLFTRRREKGLLSDQEAFDKVDRPLLIRTLKVLLKNEDGIVTQLSQVLNRLSFEELQPLWPEIFFRIENRLSQLVGNADLQAPLIALVAKHKVAEGLQVVPYMINSQNGWRSESRNKRVLKAIEEYGRHGEQLLFPLRSYLNTNLGFSVKLQEFKAKLSQSQESPELVSVAAWLGDHVIGDRFEQFTTIGLLRESIAKEDLAEYWMVYKRLQDLIEQKPDWSEKTQMVLEELMDIPKAKDIVQAHLQINQIKKATKNESITSGEAIEKLESLRDRYDIDKVGANLVYWYSKMTADRLKLGKKLK